jgi:hypothetical protein
VATRRPRTASLRQGERAVKQYWRRMERGLDWAWNGEMRRERIYDHPVWGHRRARPKWAWLWLILAIWLALQAWSDPARSGTKQEVTQCLESKAVEMCTPIGAGSWASSWMVWRGSAAAAGTPGLPTTIRAGVEVTCPPMPGDTLGAPWRPLTCGMVEVLETPGRPILDPWTHKELHWQPVIEERWY